MRSKSLLSRQSCLVVPSVGLDSVEGLDIIPFLNERLGNLTNEDVRTVRVCSTVLGVFNAERRDSDWDLARSDLQRVVKRERIDEGLWEM